MGAPVAAVDICNLALSHLSNEAITSISSPTNDAGRACARWYDATRRSVLRKHVWPFAIKRANLAAEAAAPAFGYDTQFPVPSDFIRLLTIGDIQADSLVAGQDYDFESNKILIDSDSDELPIRYIYDVTTVSQFDPLFVTLLALELAMKMCYEITGVHDSGKYLAEHLKELAPSAYAVSGQERPPRRIQRSNWKAARRFGFRSTTAGPRFGLD